MKTPTGPGGNLLGMLSEARAIKTMPSLHTVRRFVSLCILFKVYFGATNNYSLPEASLALLGKQVLTKNSVP